MVGIRPQQPVVLEMTSGPGDSKNDGYVYTRALSMRRPEQFRIDLRRSRITLGPLLTGYPTTLWIKSHEIFANKTRNLASLRFNLSDDKTEYEWFMCLYLYPVL